MSIPGSWQRGLDTARAASEYSNGPTPGYHLGAALYSGSNLLSIGFNDWYRTGPWSVRSSYHGNLHAEIMALLKRRYYDNPGNLILYISRTVTDKYKTIFSPGCSRPCDPCMRAIKLAGVKKIRFYDESCKAIELKL